MLANISEFDECRLISANQRRIVTCAGVANGGDDEWKFAYQRYLATQLANEKETLLNALSCSTDVKTLDKWAQITDHSQTLHSIRLELYLLLLLLTFCIASIVCDIINVSIWFQDCIFEDIHQIVLIVLFIYFDLVFIFRFFFWRWLPNGCGYLLVIINGFC